MLSVLAQLLRLGIEGLLVGDMKPAESLCCFLEKDTLSTA